MLESWNGAEQPPEDAGDAELTCWLANHLAGFQREHPELPQGDYYKMNRFERDRLLNAYNRARAEALRRRG